jgi:predicted RNA-binding protein
MSEKGPDAVKIALPTRVLIIIMFRRLSRGLPRGISLGFWRLTEDEMCLAKLYLHDDQKPMMENVTQITIEDGKISVETLFGDRQVFEQRIQRIDFTESRVQLAKSLA